MTRSKTYLTYAAIIISTAAVTLVACGKRDESGNMDNGMGGTMSGSGAPNTAGDTLGTGSTGTGTLGPDTSGMGTTRPMDTTSSTGGSNTRTP